MKQVLQRRSFIVSTVTENDQGNTPIKHIFRQAHVFIALINRHELRKAQGIHMNLVSSSGKLRCNILRQELRIASGHKYIHVLFAKIPIQNSFKAIQHLDFIQQKIIHSFSSNLRADICHEFFRINTPLLFFNLNQAFANQVQILRGIKSKADNMVCRNTGIQQMMIENVIQQVRLAASANARNHLD